MDHHHGNLISTNSHDRTLLSQLFIITQVKKQKQKAVIVNRHPYVIRGRFFWLFTSILLKLKISLVRQVLTENQKHYTPHICQSWRGSAH